MLTRKTQYGLMAAGGVLCLLGVAAACQFNDGARAVAAQEPPPAAEPTVPAPPPDPPPPLAPETREPPRDEKKPQAGPPKPTTPAPVTDPVPAGPAEALPTPVNAKPLPPIAAPTPAPAAPALDAPPPAAQPIPAALDAAPNALRPVGLHPAPPAAPPAAEKKDKDNPAPPPPDAPAAAIFQAPAREPAPPPATEKKDAIEPPLAPAPGPIQLYQVRKDGETLQDIGKRTLPAARIDEVFKLNPAIKPEFALSAGATVKLPGDACVPEEGEAVKPLPILNPAKGAPARPRVVLPLTGTFPCNLDEKRAVTLPRALREQLGCCETVFLSPGPDQCLWLTSKAHLDRLEQRLEQSQAREVDVRVFKRLYFAQTEKAPLSAEGRVAVSERLAQFAGLGQEIILIGADDHCEVWDAVRWKQYTQQKSAHAFDGE
jgi:division/cell wall cluster transcriptional repressor MraZ